MKKQHRTAFSVKKNQQLKDESKGVRNLLDVTITWQGSLLETVFHKGLIENM
jgi:hypothetical protein